jgi:hypothetical protein
VAESGHSGPIRRDDIHNMSSIFAHKLVVRFLHHIPRSVKIRFYDSVEAVFGNCVRFCLELTASVIA